MSSTPSWFVDLLLEHIFTRIWAVPKIGGVTASIFKNTGSNGVFHTASIERTYKKDDEWETTNSYGIKDLAALSAIAQQALGKCLELDGAGEADDELEEAA